MSSEGTTNEGQRDEKLTFSASDRNKEPIATVLRDVIYEKYGPEATLKALEVASGTGQHVALLGRRFPQIQWQPSDVEEKYVGSIRVYIEEEGLKNVLPPLVVDVAKDVSEWVGSLLPSSLDLILNINMVHISPWECAQGLFKAASSLLKPRGIMVTYGPYAVHGTITPESNVMFDRSLKSQNSCWGLRDIDDLEKEANRNGLVFDAMFDMPANNKILVWMKQEQ